MTKVKVTLVDAKIDYIEVKGHSGYANHGSDIVCAGISTAIIVSLNLIERLGLDDLLDYTVNEGLVTIKVLDVEEEILQQILGNLIYTLKDLADEYPKNIKINCIGG